MIVVVIFFFLWLYSPIQALAASMKLSVLVVITVIKLFLSSHGMDMHLFYFSLTL
jgi:hypothetical protein